MAPVGMKLTSGKGWQIVHRCERCGVVRVNRIAEGTRQPDDAATLAALAMTGSAPDLR